MAELKQAPFKTNMSAKLPDPKTWAKEHKMSEVDQAEHNRNVDNPLTAYAREEAKTEADLKEAAKAAGIDIAEDPKEKKTFTEWLAENEVKGTPQTSGDLPNPSEEQLISDNVDNASVSEPTSTGSTAPAPTSTGSTAPAPTDNANEDAKEQEKEAAKYKIKSIMDAYYDGDIDKNTRNFMIADTIAKFLRNTGKDISNIGAQYTGGAIDNSREESMWDARNQEMAKQGISAEAATVENSDKNIERQLQQNVINSGKLSNEQKNYIVSAARQINTMMKNAKTNTEKQALAQLQAALATGNVNAVTAIGGSVAGLLGGDGKSIINEMLEVIKSW